MVLDDQAADLSGGLGDAEWRSDLLRD